MIKYDKKYINDTKVTLGQKRGDQCFEKLKTITLNTKIQTCSDIEVRYCKMTHFIMFVYVVWSGIILHILLIVIAHSDIPGIQKIYIVHSMDNAHHKMSF